MTKQCTKCGETKAFKFFYRRKDRPDGYNYWCKPCCRDKNRDTYTNNKQYYRSIARKFYHTKERICGVYMLETTVGYYIGESVSIVDRMYNHKCGSSNLKLNKGQYLGYKILEQVEPDKDILRKREEYWINKLNPSLNTLLSS